MPRAAQEALRPAGGDLGGAGLVLGRHAPAIGAVGRHARVVEQPPRLALRLERLEDGAQRVDARGDGVVDLAARRPRAGSAGRRRRGAGRRGTARPWSRSTGRSAAWRCRPRRAMATIEAPRVAVRGELGDRRRRRSAPRARRGARPSSRSSRRWTRTRYYLTVSDSRVSSTKGRRPWRRSPTACVIRSRTRSRCSCCSWCSRRRPCRFLEDERTQPERLRAGATPGPTCSWASARWSSTAVARIVALVAYSALYVLAPVAPRQRTVGTPGCSRCWIVDLLFYTEHRAAHRVRILSAAPGAPQQPTVQLVHGGAPEVEPVVGTRRLAASSADGHRAVAHLHDVLDQPDLPVLRAHRADRSHVATDRIRVQHAVAPTGCTTRSDPEYLDKNYAGILIVWDRLFGSLRRGDAPPDVRADEEHRQLQPVPAAVPRVRRDRARRARGRAAGASELGYIFAPPGWTPAVPAARPVEPLEPAPAG